MEKKEILRDKNKKAPKTEGILDGILLCRQIVEEIY